MLITTLNLFIFAEIIMNETSKINEKHCDFDIHFAYHKKIQHAFCRIPVLFSYALSEEYLSNLNITLSAYLLFTDCQSVEIMLFGHEHNPC